MVIDCLPRCDPGAQGVSGSGVAAFLAAVADRGHELHSFVLLRHGVVVAECWWAPYRRGGVHALFSLSKSFTSTAVGFAVAEGRVSVDDRIVDLFPDDLPPTVSGNLAAMRVEHVLTMSTGHAVDSTPVMTHAPDGDWVKAFLAQPVEHLPGTCFCYDSGGSYLLSAIVQKVTGRRATDYLKSRLFGPLGIDGVTSETCPRGIDTGGWGVSATTEAVAKFGQLYLQNGVWNGVQLLPPEWVAAATSSKIRQGEVVLVPARSGAAVPGPSIDCRQGYGYQFWRSRHNGFRGDGAFGQFCVVMPDQDAVLAITSNLRVGGMQDVLDLCWEHLLPALQGEPTSDLPAEPALGRALAGMRLPLPGGTPVSDLGAKVTGATFAFEPNVLGMRSVDITFAQGACGLVFTHDEGASEIRCGIGGWVDNLTDLPGTPPVWDNLFGDSVLPSPATAVSAAGGWIDDSTWQMVWRYLDTPHYDLITCAFDADQVSIEFVSGQPFADVVATERPVLKGTRIPSAAYAHGEMLPTWRTGDDTANHLSGRGRA